MNAKTCKVLRKRAGYKPSKHKTRYAFLKDDKSHIIVEPGTPRSAYRSMKKHYKEQRCG